MKQTIAEDTTNKVVKFPKRHTDEVASMPMNKTEADEMLLDYKSDFNRSCTDIVYENIMAELGAMGFKNSPDESRYCEHDYILLYESILSIMNRYARIPHPMHEHVESMFTFGEEDDIIESENEPSE